MQARTNRRIVMDSIAHGPARYLDRDAALLQWCRGKRVLHLGCVGFTDCPVDQKVALASGTLHARLSAISTCTGVDLDRDSLLQMQRKGVFLNAIAGDVEQLDKTPLERAAFDVVAAADIIEHLSNPGNMLDGIRPLLAPNGRLIVSTPNAMGLPNFLRYASGRFAEGKQHVLSFNPVTLRQLLERHGYRVVETFTCYQPYARRAGSFRLGKALLERLPKFGGTLLYVAQASQAPANELSWTAPGAGVGPPSVHHSTRRRQADVGRS